MNKELTARLNGQGYRLKNSCMGVIRAVSLLRDERITRGGRVRFCLKLLLETGSYLRTLHLCLPEKRQLLSECFSVLSGGDITPTKGSGAPSVCFSQDYPLIYAAFLQSFGIDIEKQRLGWEEFCGLLAALPADTALYRTVAIRNAELPAPNAYNAQEIRRLLELKRQVAIRGNDADSFKDGLTRLFEAGTEAAGYGRDV